MDTCYYLNSTNTPIGYLQCFIPHPPLALLHVDVVKVHVFICVPAAKFFYVLVEGVDFNCDYLR